MLIYMLNNERAAHAEYHKDTITTSQDDDTQAKIRGTQHRSINVHDRAEPECLEIPERFSAEYEFQHQHQQSKYSKEIEIRLPAKKGLQITAYKRGNNWRRRPDDGKQTGIM